MHSFCTVICKSRNSVNASKIPVTVTIDGDDAQATGQVDVIRTDFGLGAGSSWLDAEGVALEVTIEFELYATRAAL